MVREDRDHCIKVNFDLIQDCAKEQYEIEEGKVVAVGLYDFFSVMQYPQCNSFGISEEKCHEEKIVGDKSLMDKYRGNKEGQNTRLSPCDIRSLTLLYGSPE